MVSVTSGNASVHKDRTLLTATKTDGKAKSKIENSPWLPAGYVDWNEKVKLLRS
jgi:hypothetical protein